jgi:hypothetical protein
MTWQPFTWQEIAWEAFRLLVGIILAVAFAVTLYIIVHGGDPGPVSTAISG